MRILQVRFNNLNSLVGEWRIDLDHPAYTADSIFAITGPTGAGKSTILDAICLALYGRTPRLAGISQAHNEIMSRQTGECSSEVTFTVREERYRCSWRQHRARKRPDGVLQQPRRELVEAATGKVLESSITGVANRIETLTGMDFDRFTRSMLLAQGGFAAFLQAPPDERAPILEQITGTEIYSRISMGVHERLRVERDQLQLLQAETNGIVVLEPEQEKEFELALVANQQDEAMRVARAAALQEAIVWRIGIDGLHKELAGLDEEAATLQAAIAAFAPDRERLDRAMRAAALDGAHATLTAVRRQQAEDRTALQAEAEVLPALAAAATALAGALQTAEQQTARAREELQAAAPLVQQVRSLDQRIAERHQAVREAAEGCQKEAATLDATNQLKRTVEEKRSQSHQELESAAGYLKAHAHDAWLVGGLAGVEEQLRGLLARHSELLHKEAEREKAMIALERAAKALDGCRQRCGHHKQGLEEATKRLQQDQEALGRLLGDRLLREYRTEKEALLRELALRAKIAELEEHRKRLTDGAPCPLCGATEHPYALGNIPVPDEIEREIAALTALISQAEEREGAIRRGEEAVASARTTLTAAEMQEAAAVHERQAAERTLSELQQGLDQLRAEVAERRQRVVATLQPLGITALPEGEAASLLESLRVRLQTWQGKVTDKAAIEQQLADLDSEVRRLDAVIATHNTSLAEKRARLETLQAELAATRDERQALYGARNPDDEERRLHQGVTDSEGAEKQARARHSEHQQQWQAAQARVASLKERIDQRQPELGRLEAAFVASLAPAGFANEEPFLAARLAAGERDQLAARARELDECTTELKARRADRATRLAQELAKQVTDQPLAELEPQARAEEEALQALRETIALLKHRLSDNAAARERIREKQLAIEARQRECGRWQALHELIGSADGKKFRNYAQGLTFELVVSQANRQLRKMTDRYLLVRDAKQPLELNVIDSYQAGETRSTKNLSGGESFLVSLALALGLSHMASRNVRVDSLFLDEGFGTLDDEALETALETLAGLRQEGKLIGVISHVPALRERIATRIQVEPHTGGRSLLSGPGCARITPAAD